MKTLIVICGPTASGKTSLAIRLARDFHTEIISADSRQFYKRMNIGTAKPSSGELLEVKHHFIDTLEPEENYNVSMFEKDALNVLDQIFQKVNVAVMAGGSGLYINAVCNGFDEMPGSDPEIRKNLQELLKEKGIEAIRILLMKEDPEYFSVVDKSNPHRLLRALEVIRLTGRKYSQFRKEIKKIRNFRIIKTGLMLPKESLQDRINVRVDEMVRKGLPEEVQNLISYRNCNSMQSVGYKEMIEYLEGKTAFEQAVELIKKNTRSFAKRQMTWFKKDKEIKWFHPDEYDSIVSYIRREIQ